MSQQFALQDMMPEDIAKLVKNGIGSQLEDMIYKELRAQAEATTRKVAKEIAERLSAQVRSYKSAVDFATRIDLTFNLVDADTAKAVGTVVDVRDGVPVVAWAPDSAPVKGAKIFV